MSTEAILTRKLFRKYDLDVHEIEERTFLSPHYVLPCETDCKEVRITLGKLCTLDWVNEWYGHNNVGDYDKEHNEKKSEIEKTAKEAYPKDTKKRKAWLTPTLKALNDSRQDFLKHLDLAQRGKTYESEYGWTFSIFLRDEDKHLSLNSEEDILLIYESAYYYMIFLHNHCKKAYEEHCEDIFKDDLDIFKDVLEGLDLQINNDNLEKISEISYRIYKDSKFFYELKDHLGNGSYDQFIRDFEYIMNNDVEEIDFEEEVLNNVV